MNKLAKILKRFGFVIFFTCLAFFLSFDITGSYPPSAEYDVLLKWFLASNVLYVFSALFEEE